MPWTADGSQKPDMEWFTCGALSTQIYGGEPVYVNSSGQVITSGTAPSIVKFGGIAAAPFPYKRNGVTVKRNPRTGVDFAQYDPFPIWVARFGTRFITPNYYESAAVVVPTRAKIGNTVSIVLVSSVFGVDNVATTAAFKIYDVLDKNRKSVSDPTSDGYVASTGGTGVYVVVETVQSQWTVNTAASA
jgi:hypothetical protein